MQIVKKGKTPEIERVGDSVVPKKIQWVSDEHSETEIFIPKDLLKDDKFDPKSLEIVKGYAENECERLNHGEIIQFERFGFCRLDSNENRKLRFVFSC